MENKNTVFSKLNDVLFGKTTKTNQYNINLQKEKILYKGNNKDEYEAAKLEAQQNTLLSSQWKTSGRRISNLTSIVESSRLMMYRDANLMDNYPEIGAALDIYAEEASTINEKGKILNIYSSSERIKSVLEDLFINRLDIHVNLPLWVRNTCKYGDTFLLLNMDSTNGVTECRQLPVDEVDRVESDFLSYRLNAGQEPNNVEFYWKTESNLVPFKAWQIAHFRLLNDTMFLPYGVSILSKARRHWRLLTMMEDLLLIYRLERSIERRVYKIFVGNIDDADVPAYINDIANTFKRTEVIDPKTGQIDLRKNILGVDQDVFIPTRSENASNPIETLQSSNNLNTIDDLKYFQDKLVTALRVPRSFLKFDESVGDGKNLSMLDVRFERNINKIQQAMLMELNKIAIVHLYVLGFTDELNNFTLTLNNPSRQAEMLRLTEFQTKINIFRDSVQDPGNGIPMLSWSKACRDILKLSDVEIKEMLDEIRLEKAIANELSKTSEIIKRTGIFDNIDRVYGEPNSNYSDGEGDDSFGDGVSSGGMSSGGDLGLDNLGDGDFDSDIEGDASPIEPNEAIEELNMESLNHSKKPFLNEYINKHINGFNKDELKKIDALPQKDMLCEFIKEINKIMN